MKRVLRNCCQMQSLFPEVGHLLGKITNNQTTVVMSLPGSEIFFRLDYARY